MRTLHGTLAGSLALALMACGSGTKDDPTGQPPAAPSAPSTTSNNSTNNPSNNNSGTCANGSQQCSGMNLMVCKNGSWSTSTCDSLCQQAGLGAATSCAHDASKGYETCFCASASGTCTDGEQKCNGMTLSICGGGSWSTSGCDSICQQAGLGPAVSCGFDPSKGKEVCICNDPPSCQNGAQQCQNGNLATCTNEAWAPQSCDDLCHLAGYGKAQGCGFDSTKGLDTCFCYDGLTGDPCATDTDCKGDGAVCNTAGWCTRACTHDSECGQDSTGKANFCMETQAGSGACFPSCSSNAGCATFAGTSCFFSIPSMDGATANVCSTN